MLRTLRAPSGGPAFRTRVVAFLLALGMLLAAAPLLIPITRWAVGSVAPRRTGGGPQASGRPSFQTAAIIGTPGR